MFARFCVSNHDDLQGFPGLGWMGTPFSMIDEVFGPYPQGSIFKVSNPLPERLPEAPIQRDSSPFGPNLVQAVFRDSIHDGLRGLSAFRNQRSVIHDISRGFLGPTTMIHEVFCGWDHYAR